MAYLLRMVLENCCSPAGGPGTAVGIGIGRRVFKRVDPGVDHLGSLFSARHQRSVGRAAVALEIWGVTRPGDDRRLAPSAPTQALSGRGGPLPPPGGGVVVMVEPWVTAWSRIIYRRLALDHF
jgi:hypothetical protein